MKKRIILIGTLLILLILVGCGNTGEPESVDYRTGTDALTLDFPAGTITEAYENDPEVKMVVEIRNEGAFPQYDSSRELEGHIWVGGFDRSIIDLRPEEDLLDEEDLEGKSSFNLDGGYSAIVISGPVYTLPAGTTSYPGKVNVAVTYNYETIASPVVCVDPEPRSTDIREKVCDVDDYSSISLGSQGAPVEITKVEESVTYDSLLFTIYVKNSGDGTIIDEDDVYKDPNKGYDWDELNRVRISEASIGNDPMTECRPDIGDYVELLDDEGYIFCKFSTSGIDSAYTSPLNINLEYSYYNTITRNIEIFEEVVY